METGDRLDGVIEGTGPKIPLSEQERVGDLVPLRKREAPPPETREFEALEEALRTETMAEVHFDAGHRAAYATDASNYRQTPIGLVIPSSAWDVERVLAVCRRFGAPILSRGGGTSLAGQTCNAAVVLDFTRHVNRILEIDPAAKTARVQPGVILDTLNQKALRHQLRVGPDPATHNHCAIGGMIGNNSCGIHAQLAGKMEENVHELEVITGDGVKLKVGRTPPDELARLMREPGRVGEIYTKLARLRDRYAERIRERFPKFPRRVSGFNLNELLPENDFHVARALVGTEGTCVTLLEAKIRLVEWPKSRTLLVLGYDDIVEACKHIPRIVEFGPMALEGMDDVLIEDMKRKGLHAGAAKFLPQGGGWLLVEFGGETREESEGKALRLLSHARSIGNPHSKIFDDPEEEEHVWKTREAGLGATARVPGEKDAWPGWEDSAVPPERLPDYLRKLKELYGEFDYQGALYGHFGQGCVHSRISFDLTSAHGIAKWRRFLDRAADLCVEHGGSLSGEHGDGQQRAELLAKMYGPDLVEAFREFKSIWDPGGLMNPGKVVDPYPIVSNLRLGNDFHPAEPETHFRYPDDDGSFARAALRCVGIGKCRREEGGTMCPSWRATHDELQTTRGRAHLLFEMLTGETIRGGWQDEHVRESLELCLACKGCKHDCPMDVDLATYKAEFLSHYYEEKRRPRHAYAMGWIMKWARLGSALPRAANFFSRTWPFSRMAKGIAGLTPKRRVPPFATETVRSWFTRQPHPNADGPRVILWADTFNNYFTPEPAKAAKRVLEAAGLYVLMPGAPLCCGRPLYDYGMLDEAKARLVRILEYLGPYIDRGVPIVGLEPSCVSVFRDELQNLFPNHERAKRLQYQFFTLGEFLTKQVGDFPFPDMKGQKAVVHGHCHEKAVLDHQAEIEALKKCGLEVEAPDTGCCGLAGSFGFEKEKYDVSMAIGEKEIFPVVRRTSPDAWLVADGFSCREQVKHGNDRMPSHLAEVIAAGLDGGVPPRQ